MKKGLVLEGGAMRGLFTAGVTDVMMENGIEFDGIIGVSAGAAFGCNYKSKQIGRAIRYNMQYCNDERYCGLKTLIKTGDIYGADFC
ncbi:MAG: patatin-like phospholipase family protein, partial [Clostridia bacterium]|nr:patatin-like phospholipase family protein [Clostridia bacterium]